ncbi:peptide-methionine (S)-S-oxide reductase MsrA [Coraliomargarita parva]|uniref:peptide-methionine (S)-S-oxide reductase MsrA n=1 Tax=Coraliomargarita parva TaxID=3014050 RepID=UPI0022B5A8C2|nr:peptide-methionine (S)-S-oxide reductase MsrA [Coraliomargarita parva]
MTLAKTICLLIFTLAGTSACSAESESPSDMPTLSEEEKAGLEVACFGAGCFWCVEAVFERLDGVKEVESGYMGGDVPNPSYREVCTGRTGHAEVTRIYFDPAIISYAKLLEWFWKSHDPTTLNRQGADVGTQYRSVIFYYSEEQRTIAEAAKIKAQKLIADPIVTEITAASVFYPAEDYHQDYYQLNGSAPYCRAVIRPKLEKLHLE